MIIMDELKRNGSGYYDPTAYKAMKNIEKGEETMKRGEIWEIGYGMEAKYAVIVSVQEIFCNVLVLSDECKGDHDIAIKATGMRYTNPAMLSYAYKDRFNRFIRAMRDDELEELLAKITEKLDFPASVNDEARFEKLLADKNEEIEALKVELEETTELATSIKKELFVLRNQPIKEESQEIAVLKAQLEIYKQQNEMMFNRLVGA